MAVAVSPDMRNRLSLFMAMGLLYSNMAFASGDATDLCTISDQELSSAIHQNDKKGVFGGGSVMADLFKQNQVVIIGDVHGETDIRAIDAVQTEFSATSAEKLCFAVEFPYRDDHNIEVTLSLIKDMSTYAFEVFYPPMQQARKHGLRVISVDHPDRFIQDITDLDVRNTAMADNVRRILNDGTCDRVLFMVGKGHMGKINASGLSIQDRMKGLKVATIDLKMGKGEGFTDWMSKREDLCDAAKFKAQDFHIFSNAQLSANPEYFDLDEIADADFFELRVKDFDYTLMTPYRGIQPKLSMDSN